MRRSSIAPGARQPNEFPNMLWSNLFLGATVVECLVNMALESYVFARFVHELNLDNTTSRTIPTYLAIYICAFVFQLWLAFWACGKRNMFHIFALVIFNFAFLVYSAVQIKEFHNVLFGTAPNNDSVFDPDSPLAITRSNHAAQRNAFWHHLLPFVIAVPCVIAVGQAVYLVCVFFLYRSFGWDIYQRLGADRSIKRQFIAYQTFVVLLCYCWFFFGGFTVQLLILYTDTSDWAFWITVAALPVTILGLLAAGYAVRHEIRWLMLVFDACLIAAVTYFCYYFWKIFSSRHADDYRNDRITLGIFAAVSLVLLVLTFINSIFCHSYFGKTTLWEKQRKLRQQEQLQQQQPQSGNFGPSRTVKQPDFEDVPLYEQSSEYLPTKRLILD
ncbi:hypothetical protein PYCC9005_001203 [Savitreella phatthalungensis]